MQTFRNVYCNVLFMKSISQTQFTIRGGRYVGNGTDQSIIFILCFFQLRGKVKVTIRWNEPERSNGVIDFYDLKINCYALKTNCKYDLKTNCSIVSNEQNCQESVRLEAREREFFFSEDPRENQVTF
jgi:hypothetical protein